MVFVILKGMLGGWWAQNGRKQYNAKIFSRI
jgi:hypothetical protein